jgi:hypothetical protein
VSSVEVAVPVEVMATIESKMAIESTVAIESMVHFTPTWMASLEALPGRSARLTGCAHRQQDCDGGERYKCEAFWVC